MTTRGPIYCLDASVLIEAASRTYPPDVFPAFWDNLDELAAAGRAVAPDEVYREVTKGSDHASEWTKAHREIFVPLDEDLQAQVTLVLGQFPRMVKVNNRANTADPFIVALARLRGLVVVTMEHPGSAEGPKIPFVCKQLGIRCMNLLEMMRAERWTF